MPAPDSPTLLVVAGPTASGKTAWAIQRALETGAEILSADSRQFYLGMDIGTAKPTTAERALVPHHFLDFLPVEQPYSAGQFAREVLLFLEDYFRKKNLAILVGGSGLYLKAVCEGFDEFAPVSDEVREEVGQRYAAGGLEALQQAVAEADPDYYAQVDRQNAARLRRALEVCLATGKPYSSFRSRSVAERPFRIQKVAMDWPREILYERIDRRVDEMMAAGLLEEATRFHDKRHLPALQTVGYTELFDHLEGKTSLSEAVTLIKQHTRNYAKRQLTWLRKEQDLVWLRP
jgi:tRNA dimethylallyltransferase